MTKQLFIALACFLATSTLLAQQVEITFELNTATIQTIDPGGVYIAGGSGFGNPGDNELTDPDGDGVYTITLTRDVGFSSFYTFLNGNCGDYSCKENIAGLSCADPDNFNDRFLPPVNSDTTLQACFGTCENDGSCTVVTDSVDITFNLDMSSVGSVSGDGVFVAGGGAFGQPGDNPMVDPEGDGVYTITLRRAMGFTSDYTFTNGNCPGDFSCKEDIAGQACAVDPFNDRNLPPVMADTVISACFGSCDGSACGTTNLQAEELAPAFFELQPSQADDFTLVVFSEEIAAVHKRIQVVNARGQVMAAVARVNADSYRLNTATYPAGLYYVQVHAAQRSFIRKFAVMR